MLVFPVVTMLIIGGSFGTGADDAFPVNPSHWYVASYLTVVIGATGLIMLPVHIASYRERGVLRRFTASGFPRWSFALAELVVGLVAIARRRRGCCSPSPPPSTACPAVEDPLRVAVAVLVGSVAFVGVGVLLGTLLPSARAAQAVGLVLFFPSFLLGVGGPPPGAMSPALRSIAGVAAAGHGQRRGPRAVAGPGRPPTTVLGAGRRAGRGGRRARRPAHLAVSAPARAASGRLTASSERVRVGRPPAVALFVARRGSARRPWRQRPRRAARGGRGRRGALVLAAAPCRSWLLLAGAAWSSLGAASRVLCGDRPANVGWFGVCVLAGWSALLAGTVPAVVFWAVAVLDVLRCQWAPSPPTPAGGLDRRHRLHHRGLPARPAPAGAARASCTRPRPALADRARAEERTRIAREMHDVDRPRPDASPCCTSPAPGSRSTTSPTRAAGSLEEAERHARRSLEEVRAAVGLLREDGAGPARPTARCPAAPTWPRWSTPSAAPGPRSPARWSATPPGWPRPPGSRRTGSCRRR